MESSLKILIVEDEIVVAMDIKKHLEMMGYTVIGIASDSDEVEELLSKEKADLAFMDINLKYSQFDGIDIASKMNIPVIYLTAYCDETTILRARETNPLGYIVKPYKEEDLKVHIELSKYKLLQSSKKTTTNKEPLGDGYYFDTTLNEVFFNDIPIVLGKYEKKLFTLLYEDKGKIVPFSKIDYEIWGEFGINTSTRRSLIFRLKSKLEHKFIENVSGVGCRLLSE